ncbi:hypothetical protein [Burkholderia contaminans]|uniref:Uncharacterized protein n=1 Tax=Burkholderia contaminans TaxID=488447 RepID=A0A3N8RKZ6_9BURK|nr:hypothetical protein [Burkholderia contaminans]RQT36160.1 hypothetical protein DF037_03855 [Burkholderia contaminans]
MKEFRFKLLSEGEKLCHFTGMELVVKTPEGSYKIYRVEGFNEGKPNFYKKPNIVQVFDLDEISCSILCQKIDSDYRIVKAKDSSEGLIEIDETFVLVVKAGIGKLEVYDTDSRVTINLPAKEMD